MGRRILLGGLFHETHAFLDEITTAADFRVRRGEAILARRGDGSTVDGFLEVAEREGWTPCPTVEATAMPSGLVDHAVLEEFWREFEAAALAAARGGLDGVWLALHGAMATTREQDPEGVILSRLRALPGFADLPVFGVFDLHATFTPAMAAAADGLLAYRENPHADAREAAARSAKLLARALRHGRRPRMTTRSLPIVWPPTGTGTADEPMASLEALAREIEAADPDVWAVNVVAGFAYADARDAGVSVSLIGDGGEADAARHLDRLANLASSLRERGVPRQWRLADALDDAARRRWSGPALIVEPSDNIGGGAAGDATSVARAFLARGLQRAAVVIADPEAVAALAGLAIGAVRSIAVGGKRGRPDPGPLALDATLIHRSDGRFTLEDRQSHLAAAHGVHIDMGPCATVRSGGVDILLTSRKTPPFDLGQLRSQGIVPEDRAYIGVKAAVAHRRAYEPIAGASYTISAPGPCPDDLTALPYRWLRRPVFPLDPPWRAPALENPRTLSSPPALDPGARA